MQMAIMFGICMVTSNALALALADYGWYWYGFKLIWLLLLLPDFPFHFRDGLFA